MGWSGEKELADALGELNNVRPPPSSKIKAVVHIAFKYPTEFKMVVFDIEKWIKKSNIDDRIAGIFVIDSVCRGCRSQHGGNKDKDYYSSRFQTRISEIFSLMIGASEKDIVRTSIVSSCILVSFLFLNLGWP